MPETRTPDLAPGATDLIEADTAEAAIEEAHRRFGADARIVEARRTLRGGIGGFFAREVVELHVAPAPPAAGAPAPRVSATGAPVDRLLTGGLVSGLADAPDDGSTHAVAPPVELATAEGEVGVVGTTDGAELAAALAGIVARGADEPEEVDFATYLRRHLDVPSSGRPAAPPRDRSVATGPDDVDQAARRALLDRARAGTTVPTRDPAPAMDLAPVRDPKPLPEVDLGGVPVARLGAALDAVPVPFAAAADGPVTEAPGVGPAWSAAELLRLGVPVDLVRSLSAADGDDDLAWTTAVAEAVRPLCRPLPLGAAVLVGPRASVLVGAPELGDAPAARSERWRVALGDARWTHLVVGGDGWRSALRADVLAVSWTRPEDLPEAVRCAAELGLVLGCGPLGGAVRRATPLDVALELRSLVAGR